MTVHADYWLIRSAVLHEPDLLGRSTIVLFTLCCAMLCHAMSCHAKVCHYAVCLYSVCLTFYVGCDIELHASRVHCLAMRVVITSPARTLSLQKPCEDLHHMHCLVCPLARWLQLLSAANCQVSLGCKCWCGVQAGV